MFALYVATGGHVSTESGEAKDRAARAWTPSIKRAFEDVATCWLMLAEQVERMEKEKSPLRDERK
jgi:hypothetical protein